MTQYNAPQPFGAQPEKLLKALQEAGATEHHIGPVKVTQFVVTSTGSDFEPVVAERFCNTAATLLSEPDGDGNPLNWPVVVTGVLPTEPGTFTLTGNLVANSSTRLKVTQFERAESDWHSPEAAGFELVDAQRPLSEDEERLAFERAERPMRRFDHGHDR